MLYIIVLDLDKYAVYLSIAVKCSVKLIIFDLIHNDHLIFSKRFCCIDFQNDLYSQMSIKIRQTDVVRLRVRVSEVL